MACCPPGSHPYLAVNYEATGTVVTEGEHEFYINKGTENPTSAIIIFSDVWGWNGGHVRAVADYFANSYMVVCPKLLTPTLEGGTDGDAMAPHCEFNMEWIKQFPWSVQKPKVDAAIQFCKGKGITKIAVMGFCYGGHPACWASSENPDIITCGVVFHPSMQLEKFAFGGDYLALAKSVKCPFLIVPAGSDLAWFGEESKFGPALKSSTRGTECVWKNYLDMEHGWVVRGDVNDEAIKRDREAAIKDASDFLAKHLPLSRL